MPSPPTAPSRQTELYLLSTGALSDWERAFLKSLERQKSTWTQPQRDCYAQIRDRYLMAAPGVPLAPLDEAAPVALDDVVPPHAR
jgi:hypothetical protein